MKIGSSNERGKILILCSKYWQSKSKLVRSTLTLVKKQFVKQYWPKRDPENVGNSAWNC